MAEPKHIVIKHKSAAGRTAAGAPKVIHARPAVPPVMRKRKPRGKAIAVGVILVLLAIGAVLGLLHVYEQQQREVRLDALALQEVKTSTESLYDGASADIDKMQALLAQADERVARVTAITGFVTNAVGTGSADAAVAPPPHHAALVGIAREVAASRNAVDSLLIQVQECRPTLDAKRAAVQRAQRRVVAAAALAEIETQLAFIENALGEARTIVESMDPQLVEAESLRQEEIRLRQARAEAERRQREAEALQRLTESEFRKATDLLARSKEPISRLAFSEALAPMETALAGFKTASGKALLALPVERLQRLQALKSNLIDCLNATPYRWGWGMTAADSQDVTGADESGVKITRGEVAWKDVPLPQLLKLIDYLGKTARRRSSERATDMIATAILLDERGMREQACERVREAIAINRLLADDARRLLPDCK